MHSGVRVRAAIIRRLPRTRTSILPLARKDWAWAASLPIHTTSPASMGQPPPTSEIKRPSAAPSALNGAFASVRFSSRIPKHLTTSRLGQDLYGTILFNGRHGIATDPNRPGLVSTVYSLLDPNPIPGEAILSRNFGRGPEILMLSNCCPDIHCQRCHQKAKPHSLICFSTPGTATIGS